MDVKLNLDRNGIVTSIDPEAGVLKAGERVVYRLVEPGRDTYYDSGNPSETSAKKLKKKQSVKAFDPLIIGEN